jgi:hypothetical protein
MKKQLLIFSVACLSFSASAQIYSATDSTQFFNFAAIDADGDTQNWGVYDMTGAGFGVIDAQGSVLGSRSWVTAGPLTPDNWIFSEVVDLTAVSGTIGLNWKCGSPETTASGWHEEYFSVYVMDGVANFNPVTATPIYSGVLPGGEQMYFYQHNISNMAGVDSLIIAFRHHNCTDENFLFLDDINVTQGLGLEDMNNFSMNVFPNPATDVLNFKSEEMINTVSIIGLDGKVYAHNDGLNTNNYVLSVASLSSGMYVYEVISSNGKISRNSFVKK